MNNQVHISVVIPVYGCNDCLNKLYDRLAKTLAKISNRYEIILINDGSPDNSWTTIKSLSLKDDRVKGINFSRNFGQHYAITAGLDNCTGEWVVVMDCDLQDQPEEILKLYNKAKEGYDCVLGNRYQRQDKFFKSLFSKVFYKVLSYLTDTEQNYSIANFGIYQRKVIDTIKNMRENLRYFPVLVRWTGFNTVSIDIEHSKRNIGESQYTFKKMLKLGLNVIIAFSDKPLRLTVRLGLTISFIAVIYAAVVTIRALYGDVSTQGWSSLIISIWFLSGLIIFTMGVIGIYLGKAFDEIKKRPIYIISEMVGK